MATEYTPQWRRLQIDAPVAIDDAFKAHCKTLGVSRKQRLLQLMEADIKKPVKQKKAK